MPKRTSYKKIGENKYEFENKVIIASNSTSFVRLPMDLARKLEEKKLKVTIEEIKDK